MQIRLPNPTIQPSLITPRTLTKEPILGIRPRNLPKNPVLRFGQMSRKVRSLFFFRFTHQNLLTPNPPIVCTMCEVFLHFFWVVSLFKDIYTIHIFKWIKGLDKNLVFPMWQTYSIWFLSMHYLVEGETIQMEVSHLFFWWCPYSIKYWWLKNSKEGVDFRYIF